MAYTSPYFVCMLDCILNSSFSTLMPWDLHLNFCSEMIKQNMEWHKWRKMHKKSSKAFVDFWVIYILDVCYPSVFTWYLIKKICCVGNTSKYKCVSMCPSTSTQPHRCKCIQEWLPKAFHRETADLVCI